MLIKSIRLENQNECIEFIFNCIADNEITMYNLYFDFLSTYVKTDFFFK